LRRGFKALTERNADAARAALGLTCSSALDPWVLATHLSVVVLDFDKLGMSAESIAQLTHTDSESWSAMTIQIDQTLAIVINPSHALTRQRADMMHELSHLHLKHSPARVDLSDTGLFLLSNYSEEHEQEADWYAAAFLLPREGLIQMRAANQSVDQIAAHYGISEALCEWRLRMTGVDIQLKRARSRS
jgi:Zn-dependent peptidase ImmA (M78 family)